MAKKNSPTYIIPLAITFLLILIGLIFISLSSLSEAEASFGDKFYFLKKQLLWAALGCVCLFVTAKIKIQILKKFSFHFYLLTLLLLFLVLLSPWSTETYGARRWFNLGGLALQPSELFKLSLLLFFPFQLAQENKRNLKFLALYLLPPVILIILEPNLSTAVLVTAVGLTIYYLSGAKISQLLLLCAFSLLAAVLLVFSSPYRQARLNTLLNPGNDPSNSSYHSRQITISLASGGLFGKGLANSNQKYQYLPKLTTDSILAVIGEETGFIGILFIILLYLVLFNQLFALATAVTDPAHRLILSTVTVWIAYQSIINFAAIASLIPLTGIPLPFISYGGSSLLSLMTAIGISINLSAKNDN